jgi:Dual specificity protein phosphatase, N-terminal half
VSPCVNFHPGVGLKLQKQIERVLHSFNRLFFTTFPSPTPHASHANRTAQAIPPTIRSAPRSTSLEEQAACYHYFTIDDDLTYLSFFEDWGPLNIAMVYRACIYIHELLEVRLFAGAIPDINLTCGLGCHSEGASIGPVFVQRSTSKSKRGTHYSTVCGT